MACACNNGRRRLLASDALQFAPPSRSVATRTPAPETMSCYSIRRTTTSALPRGSFPDPLLDNSTGRTRTRSTRPASTATPTRRRSAAPRRASASRRRSTRWPPHAASLARLEQSGLQPSPRVLPGADQVRTPYGRPFASVRARSSAPTLRWSIASASTTAWRCGSSAASAPSSTSWAAPQGAVARDRRRVRRGRAPRHPRRPGSLLRDEALRRSRAGRTVVGTTAGGGGRRIRASDPALPAAPLSARDRRREGRPAAAATQRVKHGAAAATCRARRRRRRFGGGGVVGGRRPPAPKARQHRRRREATKASAVPSPGRREPGVVACPRRKDDVARDARAADPRHERPLPLGRDEVRDPLRDHAGAPRSRRSSRRSRL